MKLLVHVALAPKTPKLYGRTVTSLFNAEWEGRLDLLFARNDHPAGTGTLRAAHEDLCAKHNQARDLALAGGYDAVLFVENDMVLPEDALQKLCAVPSDVVYGLYCSRHGHHNWLCATYLARHGVTWLSDNPIAAKADWGKVIPSHGAGFGCTLVRRAVLEAIPFRLEPAPADPGLHLPADDWHFALDVAAHGFSQAHHLGVACGHVAKDDRGAYIVWPDPNAAWMHSVEYVGGTRTRTLEPGETITLRTQGLGIQQLFKAEATP